MQRALGIARVVEHGLVGLKVGQLVEGNADLYLHPKPKSSRWDSCAPEAVIRAAGGELVVFDRVRYRHDGVESTNVRGLVGGATETVKVVLPVATKVAKETGLVS
jgi:3'(2'), 5'-bisphosphate nucleotidase